MSTSPIPATLPRGRHKLSPEEVSASQRMRLLRGVVDEVDRRGYEETTVGHVVAAARVSRETFYGQFASKVDCFWAAHDELLESLEAAVVASAHADGTPFERLEVGLRALLQGLAADPAGARVLLLERPGPRGARSPAEAALHERATEALMRLFETDDRFACEAFAALVEQLVVDRLAGEGAETLPALADPLLALLARRLADGTRDLRLERLAA